MVRAEQRKDRQKQKEANKTNANRKKGGIWKIVDSCYSNALFWNEKKYNEKVS